MSQVVTPQQNTIRQYQADGLTTTFNYNFLVLESADMAVYVTAPGQPANPPADIVSPNDYTVTGIGVPTGGQVIFNVAPVNSSIVTLSRNMQFAITTQFNDAQNFNGQSLDDAFQRLVLIMQQMQGTFNLNSGSNGSISRCLQYVIDTYLPNAQSNVLPILTNIDNQVWISQGGAITAAVLQNDNMSTFRSQIASQNPVSDGASLVGYYDANNLVGQTLNTFLNNLPTYILNVVSGTSFPNIQQLTTGSGTYTTPAGAVYLHIIGVAPGGGGGGSGTAGATQGGNAGNTVFGAVTATGGSGGNSSGTGGAGGTVSGATLNYAGVAGAPGAALGGASAAITLPGGQGGSAVLFGGGGLDTLQATGAGTAGLPKTGGGGSGGGIVASAANHQSGSGGGAGASFELWIKNPAATYSWSIGSPGTAGAAGTSGVAGGAGGSGQIIIEAYFS